MKDLLSRVLLEAVQGALCDRFTDLLFKVLVDELQKECGRDLFEECLEMSFDLGARSVESDGSSPQLVTFNADDDLDRWRVALNGTLWPESMFESWEPPRDTEKEILELLKASGKSWQETPLAVALEHPRSRFVQKALVSLSMNGPVSTNGSGWYKYDESWQEDEED